MYKTVYFSLILPKLQKIKKSPSFLQHAFNPVRWYPWSEFTFAKAEQEDEPIFLSTGYSTCIGAMCATYCNSINGVYNMESFYGSPYLNSLIEKYNYVEILNETFDSVIAPEFRKRGFRKHKDAFKPLTNRPDSEGTYDQQTGEGKKDHKQDSKWIFSRGY